jgi:hypothetical protein
MERREDGLAGIILVAVLVWVLLAVGLLAQTLWDTHTVNADVARIDRRLAGINGHTDAVALASRTGDLARDIASSVQPLSGQLSDLLATPIPDKAAAIAAEASDIERTVGSIQRTVHAIQDTVAGTEPGGSNGSLEATVAAISVRAADIERTAAGIGDHVAGIRDRSAGIEASLSAIEDAARSIRGTYDTAGLGNGVAGIDHRVDAVIALAQGIHADLAVVVGIVDPAGGPGPGANLYGHVKSIDDESLLTLLGALPHAQSTAGPKR